MIQDLVCYKEMPIWTQERIPQGFQRPHNTKAGTWAKLEVLKGELSFAFVDESGAVQSTHVFTPEQQPPFIEPQRWHQIVSASADVECQLKFYCTPQDYFHKKYAISPTHSEIVAATPYLTGGHALDVGCGEGRNSLYLNQMGYKVDAWDVNSQSLEKFQQMIDAEEIQQIHIAQRDLNADPSIFGNYDFICCTVVMMFLEAKTIPPLIAQMQQATKINGYNLIVCAMDTDDIPAQPDFPFAFKEGELSALYKDWKLIKYNEDVGELYRRDEQGNHIKQHFATMLAQKVLA